MPLYALTIFTGAFLLFLVQPLIGKYILPWFGGSPGVWTTCLLFFQTLLLGGYAYAHLTTTKLRPKQQATLHLILLVVSLAWLPIIPGASWKPTGGEEPTLRILFMLLACLGMPYLVLSATGPLLQRWFSLTHPHVPPYRLYALSNVGSLLALLGYPFVFEPLLSRTAQGYGWSVALVVFVGLCGFCAWQVRKLPDAPVANLAAPSNETGDLADADSTPSALDKFMWLALPAVASVLLMATTNKLCLDVAVVPFLWVLPLSIYLLSFILCFDHPRWYSQKLFGALFAAGCGSIVYLLHAGSGIRLPVQVSVYSLTLFAACMICHGELYRLKPTPKHLTKFYLLIAAGGALGGLVVAVIAPLIFNEYRELQLGLGILAYLTGVICLLYRSRSLVLGIAAGVLGLIVLIPILRTGLSNDLAKWFGQLYLEGKSFYAARWREILGMIVVMIVTLRASRGFRLSPEWRRRMAAFPLVCALLLGVVFTIQAAEDARSVVLASRNFYGTLKLHEYSADEPDSHYLLLAHGETTHGLQLQASAFAWRTTSYYGATSGVGRALDLLKGQRRIGLVGLGVGTLATYGQEGDTLHFYEINADIVSLAREHFTYLDQSPAKVEIALGDARLVMEQELARGEKQNFDLLALDAFSSDAIPVHLLTKEAFGIYLQHMRPGGVIAVHISNRYLDLRPVVEALAKHYQLHFATIDDQPEPDQWWLYGSTWVLLSTDKTFLEQSDIADSAQEPPDATANYVLWTDDHASMLKVLK
ncbi:spermidine synthase [Oleiharenicola lentus]|uniref:spermidine synthase n=1 Tax=Oleiharenicola lentus TaxID=2508720 RepID=UPI003F67319F